MADRDEEQCVLCSTFEQEDTVSEQEEATFEQEDATVKQEYAAFDKDEVFRAYKALRERFKTKNDIKKDKDVRRDLLLRMAALRKRGAELGVTGDELESGRDRAGSLYSGQGSVENWQDEVSRKTGSHYTGTSYSYNNSQQSGGKTGSEPFDGSDSSV